MISELIDSRKRILAVKMGIEAFEARLGSISDPESTKKIEKAILTMKAGLAILKADHDDVSMKVKQEKEWKEVESTLCWCQGTNCTLRRETHFVSQAVTRFLWAPGADCQKCEALKGSLDPWYKKRRTQ